MAAADPSPTIPPFFHERKGSITSAIENNVKTEGARQKSRRRVNDARARPTLEAAISSNCGAITVARIFRLFELRIRSRPRNGSPPWPIFDETETQQREKNHQPRDSLLSSREEWPVGTAAFYTGGKEKEGSSEREMRRNEKKLEVSRRILERTDRVHLRCITDRVIRPMATD